MVHFSSFLAGLGQKTSVLCMLLAQTAHKLFDWFGKVRKQQALRDHCPNIYTVPTASMPTYVNSHNASKYTHDELYKYPYLFSNANK